MKKQNKKQLGKANELRGTMDSNDLRDYMLSFLFLRYLSGNDEEANKKELDNDCPKIKAQDNRTPLSVWYKNNAQKVLVSI
ncbi:Type I restriction-modification system, DNA-methyltransferase subunit M (EC 2.1.1.72) [uncultured Gammaproteobacteria bacterium]|nr:Type I restriction-modification system, DNA-methyltransferase subunit M (EC 2.1.1.72) [uncultured Gammaproteobacteria bacterium]